MGARDFVSEFARRVLIVRTAVNGRIRGAQ